MFIMRKVLAVVLVVLLFGSSGCGVPYKKASRNDGNGNEEPSRHEQVKPEDPDTLALYLPQLKGWQVQEELNSLQLQDGSWYWAGAVYRRDAEELRVELLALDWEHSLLDFIRRSWPEKEFSAGDGSFARVEKLAGQQVYIEYDAAENLYYAGAIAGRFIVLLNATSEEGLREALEQIDLKSLAGFR